MKKLMTGIILALLLAGLVSFALADWTGYTAKENVNVRAEAASTSRRIEQLTARGTAVQVAGWVHGTDADYYEVYTQAGNHGYIRMDLLTESGGGELTGTVLTFPRGKRYNVYSGPGEHYLRGADGKAVVSTNDWIEVFGRDGDWALVQYNVGRGHNRIGYIRASNLPKGSKVQNLDFAYTRATVLRTTTLTDDPLYSGAALMQCREGETVTVLSHLSSFTYVEAGNARGFIRSEDLSASGNGASQAAAAPDTDMQAAWIGITNRKDVNVRVVSDKSSQKVTTIRKAGTEVTLLSSETGADGMEWFEALTADGLQGFIRGDFLTVGQRPQGTSNPPSPVQTAETVPPSADAEDAYRAFLQGGIGMPYASYAFYDMDQDGIPELIVKTGTEAKAAWFFTFDGMSVQPLNTYEDTPGTAWQDNTLHLLGETYPPLSGGPGLLVGGEESHDSHYYAHLFKRGFYLYSGDTALVEYQSGAEFCYLQALPRSHADVAEFFLQYDIHHDLTESLKQGETNFPLEFTGQGSDEAARDGDRAWKDAYLQVLQLYRDGIQTYERGQERENGEILLYFDDVTGNTPLYVLLTDLTGGGTDELLFLAARDDDRMYDWYGDNADLYVFTFDGTRALQMLRVEYFYCYGGNYPFYEVYRVQDAPDLYLRYGNNGPGTTALYTLTGTGVYTMAGSADALFTGGGYDEDHEYEYSVNGRPSDRASYEAAIRDLDATQVGEMLVCNLEKTGASVMTWEEAVRFLQR
ncbi:MAG: hypothetical protein IJ083_16790 [Clostridia bacterium]|nr:hypothetical protein [Clostridia bacterium]